MKTITKLTSLITLMIFSGLQLTAQNTITIDWSTFGNSLPYNPLHGNTVNHQGIDITFCTGQYANCENYWDPTIECIWVRSGNTANNADIAFDFSGVGILTHAEIDHWVFGSIGYIEFLSGSSTVQTISTPKYYETTTVFDATCGDGIDGLVFHDGAGYICDLRLTFSSLVHGGPDQTICEGGSVTLSPTVTGPSPHTHSWTPTVGLSNPNIQNPVASPTTTTTYTLTVTDADGCEGTGSVDVIVEPGPTVDLDLGDDEACADETTLALTGGTPAGGTFSGPGVAGTNFDPSTAGVGVHTITYTYTGSNGCPGTATDQIEVFPLPSVSLSLGVTEVCEDATSLALTGGSPAGGTYSGTGVSGTTFNPGIAGPGYHTITYTYTNSGGCTGYDTQEIEVFPSPIVTLNLLEDEACDNETALYLGGSNPIGLAANAFWTGPAIYNYNVVNPSIAGAGLHTITYTYTDNRGCTGSGSDVLEIFPSPTVTFSLVDDEACIDETTHALSGGTPLGGSYSGPGVSGTNFNPNSAGVGVHTITYTYTDNNGCSNEETDEIEVFGSPAIDLSLSDDEACEYETTLVLSGGTPLGGTYSGPGVSGTNFNASSAGVGIHTITYSYTDNNGCSNTETDQIEVLASPAVDLSLSDDEACEDETTLILSGGTPLGGTYSGPGVSGTNFNASSVGVGIHTITYSYTDANGCSNEETDEIEVFGSPTVSLTLGDDDACVDDIVVPLTGGLPAGGTYSGTSVGNSNFLPFMAGVGVHTITYTFTDSNGCIGTTTDEITVYALPTVSLNLPVNEQCEDNTTLTLSGGLPVGGTYSGPGVSGTNFNASLTSGSYQTITYTYTDSNGCVNEATDIMEVNEVPDVTLSLSNDEACEDETTLFLSGGFPPVNPSITSAFYSGPGVSGTNFNPSVAGVGVHTISYTVTNTDGCSNTATDQIEVFASPTVAVSLADDEACENEITHVLSGGTPLGGTYSGPGVSGSNFNASIAGVGIHTITYSYTDNNGCSNTETDQIEVFATPTVAVSLVDDEACEYETTLVLSGGSPLGGNYSGPGVSGSNFNASIAGVGIHTITYSYTDNNGCSDMETDQIEVFASPAVDLSLSNDEACEYETTLALSGGTPLGGTYSGPGVSGTIFNASSAGVGVHTITYSYTDNNGCSNTETDQIEVFASPAVDLSLSDDEACEYETTLVLSGGTPLGGTYSGPGVSGTNFNASSAGVGIHTITYSYTDNNGCSNTETDQIEVFARPTVAVSLVDDEACEYETTHVLSGGIPLGGTYSGPGVSGTNFNASTAGVGIHTITYSYTDNNGCSNTETDQIEVFASPAVDLSLSDDEACEYETTLVLSGGTPLGGTYSGPGVSGTNFNASSAGVGIHTITYSYTDNNGCSDTETDQIEVFAQPIVNLSLASDEACESETTLSLSGGSPSGGTYSGPGVSGTNFSAASAGVGIHTITYTYTDSNGCEDSDTDLVEVFANPTVSLVFAGYNICESVTNTTLTGGLPSGGTYSGPGVSGTNFDATIAGVGVHVITYSYTDSNGCSNSSTDNLEVFEDPTVTLNLGDDTACVNETTLALSGGSPAGGTYSGPGVSGSNFNASVAGLGVHTITYNYLAPNECSGTATQTIEVFDAPPVTLDLPQTQVCNNVSNLNLSGGFPIGGVYSGPGVSNNNFNVAAAGVGTHTITYTYTTGGDCDGFATEEIVVIESVSDVQLDVVATISCFGTEDGSAQVIPLNGTGPYNIMWDNGESGMTATALAGGTHSVSITDYCDTEVVLNFEIAEPPQLDFGILDLRNAECNQSGFISVRPIGGTGPYSISLDGGPLTMAIAIGERWEFSDIVEGDHYFYISDGNGCSVDEDFYIGDDSYYPRVAPLEDIYLGCSEDSVKVNYYDLNKPDLVYNWYFMDSLLPINLDRTATLLESGVYLRKVSYRGSNCHATDTLRLTNLECDGLENTCPSWDEDAIEVYLNGVERSYEDYEIGIEEGEEIEISINENLLPDDSHIEWWLMDSSDEVPVQNGTLIGNSAITSNWTYGEQYPELLAISYKEDSNQSEYFVVGTGSGLYIDDLTIALEANCDSTCVEDCVEQLYGDGCDWKLSDKEVLKDCPNIIPVGPGDYVPPNSALVVYIDEDREQLIRSAKNLCSLDGCIYVMFNQCDRCLDGFADIGRAMYTLEGEGFSSSLSYMGEENGETVNNDGQYTSYRDSLPGVSYDIHKIIADVESFTVTTTCEVFCGTKFLQGVIVSQNYNSDCCSPYTPMLKLSLNCNGDNNLDDDLIFEDYPFLNDLVDAEDCEDVTISVYNSGNYSFVYLETQKESVLYFQDGTRYCTDTPGFSCLSAYNLTDPSITWSCDTGCTEEDDPGPSIFVDYPWLADIVDPNDCEGVVVELYQFGNQLFPYVITDESAILYSHLGQQYCASALPSFDCIELYGLSDPVYRWTCDGTGQSTEPIFDSYPWLSTLLDPADCVESRVVVYESGGYTYLIVKTAESVTMYNEDGLFYCQDFGSFSCVEAYGFSDADIVEVWDCNSVRRLDERAAEEVQINLFPNPTMGRVKLETNVAQAEVLVYNNYGEKIQAIKTDTGRVDIDLVSESAGIYLIVIHHRDEVHVRRVIKI